MHVVLLPLAMVLFAVAAVEAPAPLSLTQLVGACALGPHEARRDEDARHGETHGLGRTPDAAFLPRTSPPFVTVP